MKTHELISTPEPELAQLLRLMKTKELERHAAKLLHKLGAEYSAVLAAVTRAIPDLNKVEGDIFIGFQEVIRQHLKCADSAENRELIKRLAVIMMLVVQRQFQKIHQSR
jgi:hypothetical protein